MATRSTITIIGDVRWHLYRHWDGYPAENGRAIARVLRGWTGNDARELAGRLLADPAYENTDHADRHGDTEWHYTIWLFRDDTPGVLVKHRGPGDDDWTNVLGGGVRAFRNFVAGETRDLRQRVKARRAA